uniref:Uncharacterized protein n=1 Tax=Talaromyces marneffei PM1 TaxID=1077442 RepID=A0A093VDR4_TALMA
MASLDALQPCRLCACVPGCLSRRQAIACGMLVQRPTLSILQSTIATHPTRP